MKKVQLFIHIGLPKTGTSYIQGFFDCNRNTFLKEYKILYPNLHGPDLTRGRCFYHDHLFKRSIDENIQNFRQLKEIAFEQDLKILISCEAVGIRKFMNATQTISKDVGFDTSIIAYVRRQDHMLESYWKQVVMKSDFINSIDEYVDNVIDGKKDYEFYKNLYSYELLEKWREVYGKEKIFVRVYEEEHLKDGLLNDFCKILGVKISDDLKEPERINKNFNDGMSPEILELLSKNKSLFNHMYDHKPFDFIYDLLGEEYFKKPFEKYNLLSPEQRTAVISKFQVGNERISKEYLNRKNGELFAEKMPTTNEPWEPYTGLTREQNLSILLEMIYKQYKNSFHLKEEIIGLRKRIRQLENDSSDLPKWKKIFRKK